MIPSLVGLLNDSVELVRKMAKDLLDEISHFQDRALLTVIQKELTDQNIKAKIADAFMEQKVELKSPKLKIKSLEKEIHQMIELFKGKETEQNWQKREANLKWIKEKFLDQEDMDYEEVVEHNAKYLVDAMLQSSLSLRTSLCLSGLTVMSNFIKAYSTRIIDSVAEQIFNGLVKASYQSKKMISLEISKVFHILFEKTTHGLRLIPQISALIDEKSVNLRENCIQILTIILKRTKKESIEKSGHLQSVEKCLDKGLTDAQPHIRERHRDLFFIYQNMWPNKAKR